MKGKCQSGSAVISTGPQVVKQRLHAPLILVIFPADPPAGLHLAFSLYEDNFDPRLVLYVFKKLPNFQIVDMLRNMNRRYSVQSNFS